MSSNSLLNLGLETPRIPALGVRRIQVGLIGLTLVFLSVARAWGSGQEFLLDFTLDGWKLFRSSVTAFWETYPGLLIAFWPMGLGLVLLIRGSDRAVRASSVACIAMGVERGITLLSGALFDSGWRELYRGAWSPSLGRVLPSGVWLVWLMLSTAIWLGLGVGLWRMSGAASERGRGDDSSAASVAKRRRLPLSLASSVFVFAIFLTVFWTTYTRLLERAPWFRSLVLSGDQRQRPTWDLATFPGIQRARAAGTWFGQAQEAQANGEFEKAKGLYLRSISAYERLADDYPKIRGMRRQMALSANNLAWLLATCSDVSARDPDVAIVLANRAVAVNSEDGNAVNTLAVATYRAGRPEEAMALFRRSMDLRDGGSSFDWYFMAQILADKGDRAQAIEQYDRAVRWASDHLPRDGELIRFRAETAEKLGLDPPPPPPARFNPHKR